MIYAIVFGVPLLAFVITFVLCMRDEYADALLAAIGGLIAVMVVGLITALGVSTYLDVGRFDAKAACHAQRMDHLAKPLKTDVVCIPYPTRQDTTTINGGVPVKVQQ